MLSMDQQKFLEQRLQKKEQEKGGKSVEAVAPSLAGIKKKLERSMLEDNLNQQLYQRDELGDIEQSLFRGSHVAPRLRKSLISLERNITKDQVGHLLEARPEPEELVARNITQRESIAPGIAAARKKLEHSMTTDKVAHLLERREEIEDLTSRGVMQNQRVAPALQGVQRRLSTQLARSNLFHALKYRPSIVELAERGIYLPEEYYGDSEESEGEGDYQYYEDGEEYEGDEEDEGDDEKDYETYQQEQYQKQVVDESYQRRSKNFHLTRILLKFVASMAQAGELTLSEKGFLKDLIVDQDKTILAVAETFDAENDLNDFKDSLGRLAKNRR